MNFEIISIAILSIISLYLFCQGSLRSTKDVKNLKSELNSISEQLKYLEQEAEHREARPKIEELSKLYGTDSNYRIGNSVYFYNRGTIAPSIEIKISKIDSKIEELKKAIEISCPKKCVKKKR